MNEPRRLFRPLGRLRWPWRFATTTTAVKPPWVALNRYPGQAIGVHFRLPDEVRGGKTIHHGLSVSWARPDVRAYPPGETDKTYWLRKNGYLK